MTPDGYEVDLAGMGSRGSSGWVINSAEADDLVGVLSDELDGRSCR